MRAVIVREVEQFLHRPNLAPRAVYYAVIFLNQLVLRRNGDEQLAQKLIGQCAQLSARLSAVRKARIDAWFMLRLYSSSTAQGIPTSTGPPKHMRDP